MKEIETLMPVELEKWRERRLRYEEEHTPETHVEMLETGVMATVSLLNELIPIIKEVENADTNRQVKYNLDTAHNLYKTIEKAASIMQERISDAVRVYEE